VENPRPRSIKKGIPIIVRKRTDPSSFRKMKREVDRRSHKTLSPSKPSVEGLAKVFLVENCSKLPV
jgi:hypothetical protein